MGVRSHHGVGVVIVCSGFVASRVMHSLGSLTLISGTSVGTSTHRIRVLSSITDQKVKVYWATTHEFHKNPVVGVHIQNGGLPHFA